MNINKQKNRTQRRSVSFGTCGLALIASCAYLTVPTLAQQSAGESQSSKTAAGHPREDKIDAFLGEPKFEMQQVFQNERFPNIVVAVDGTLIASWGSSSVRARRSTDGGATWDDEITIAQPGFQGGGMTVDENTGDLLAFVEAHHPPANITVYRSTDNGKTWNAQETVIQPDSNGNQPSMHMNEHGITLRHGQHKGRLLRPSRWYAGQNDRSLWPKHYTNAIYSDDGGKSWKTSDPFPENGTGEATLAELSDGTIYYNSRVHWQERPNNIRRRSAISSDGGQTWKDWKIIDVLPDGPQDTNYGCMGGLVRLPVTGKDVLLYSNCDSPKGRNHGTVWASFDGGKTWPLKRLVYDGAFAYSSLNAGRPGTNSAGWAYLHFEGGPQAGSRVARFNLSWLLGGEKTGDGDLPDWIADEKLSNHDPYPIIACDSASDEVPLTNGLVISRVTGRGRIALHRDPVESMLLSDPKRIFSNGDSVEVSSERRREWETVAANENGQFAGQKYMGSYLQFVVECDEPRIMLLDAHGHNSAVINGQLRGGDTYQWWHQLPVELEPGSNQLLFHVARGRFRGKLVKPAKPVYLAANDHTLPNWIRGRAEPVWAAVPIINASKQTLTDLEIRTSIAGEENNPRSTPVGPILPLTLRKVGFEILPAPDQKADQLTVLVEIVRRGQAEPIDVKQITLAVGDASQRHQRTYVSGVDGSVQYYGVNPAATTAENEVEKPGIFLSLHGAGVEASGQAGVYQAKSDAHVIAPTNRRSFGFDWEDWGRRDALDVLADAMRHYDVDAQRIFLTGHSMGGHGTWHLGATYPDRFAAIGPSAGWISFWSYAGGRRTENPTPIVELLERAANPSDTLQLAQNYAGQGVYVLHGDRDNNVPVREARAMRKVLGEFHPDFVYYERPGAGHWWGNACCDWPPMIEFLRQHRRTSLMELSHIDFTTVCPGVSSQYGWATIVDQVRPLLASRVKFQLDRAKATIAGTTENVAKLHLDLSSAMPESAKDQELQLDLDGTKLQLPVSSSWLSQTDGIWPSIDKPSMADKGPHRYGLFKSAFDNKFVLVFGTGGTPQEDEWALCKVRYDAETFWYRGNGSIDIVADHDFLAEAYPDRNVILYGNADTNLAWPTLLGNCPLQINRTSVSLGDQRVADPNLAALFTYRRADSDRAMIGVVGGTGIEGLRSTNRLRYFVSGIAYPDILLVSADFLRTGNEALIAAGFWNSKWKTDGGEIKWRLP